MEPVTPPPPTPNVYATLWAIANFIVSRDKLIALVGVLTLIVVGSIGTVMAQGHQDAGFDLKLDPVVQMAKDEKAWRVEHLKDDAEFRRADAQWKAEQSADVRALYKAVMTGERQYRLEHPAPPLDAGQ